MGALTIVVDIISISTGSACGTRRTKIAIGGTSRTYIGIVIEVASSSATTAGIIGSTLDAAWLGAGFAQVAYAGLGIEGVGLLAC